MQREKGFNTTLAHIIYITFGKLLNLLGLSSTSLKWVDSNSIVLLNWGEVKKYTNNCKLLRNSVNRSS